jgi:hypothetical protein
MKLHGWGIARERPVLYLPDRTAPSTEALETLPGVDELDMVAALNGTLVVVTSDGVFWNYEGEEPARDDALRADYCAFIGA